MFCSMMQSYSLDAPANVYPAHADDVRLQFVVACLPNFVEYSPEMMGLIISLADCLHRHHLFSSISFDSSAFVFSPSSFSHVLHLRQ